jgi:YD repeat-containing protein
MDIVQEAQKLEKEVKSGHIEQVSEELHNMNQADRLAVAKQIEADQKKPNSSLPPLEFYESGDLKSADTKMDETTTIHTTYDKSSGKRLSEDYKNTDGSSSHWDYDTRTGWSKAGAYKYTDGSGSHSGVNSQNHKPWFVETDSQGRVTEAKGSDGNTRTFHYDESGKLDAIDGRLGHWSLTTDGYGKDVWQNKDNGAEWKGTFAVDSDGNLKFKSDNGQAWSFDRDGGERKISAKDMETTHKGEHGEIIHKNVEGQITEVNHENGTTYTYKYDKEGNLAAAKITGKDGESAHWRKQSNGEWQSYGDDGKPSNLHLKGGDWQVNAEGRMYHSSGEVVPLPEKVRT